MDFPFGKLVPPPPDFAPPEMWPEYETLALPRTPSKREVVGSDPKGIRWGVWPLYFEEYTGDKEPDMLASNSGALAYNRAVVWQRVSRTDIPKGWRALTGKAWRIDGFSKLNAGEDYTERWHPQARRNLRLWKTRFEGITHRIEPISMEEFRAAYKKSTVKRKIGNDPLNILERKQTIMRNLEHRKTWGVRNLATGEIIAGISLCHSPTFNASAYESPFILPEARKIFAMTALIDHWYAESLKKGIRYQIYNSFWQPGAPKDWKKFSAFKAQFGPECVAYPPALWRFAGGKLF